MTNRPINKIKPLENPVPDELFVNRQYELDLFWKWVSDIPRMPANSFALVGRRRTGKTTILKKLYNRLFEEQERVIPIYITFDRYLDRQKPMTSYEFAEEYFKGYIGSYLAFQYKQPTLLRLGADLSELSHFAHEVSDAYVLDLLHSYQRSLSSHIPHGLVQWVINFPKGYAAVRNMPTAIIVDEFQVLTKVYDPKQNVHHDLTDSFQQAAETRWAPLLVSGSAVSLLVDQALGGMLSGRFKYKYVYPLSRPYAHDLVFRLGAVANIEVTEELAEAIWQLTEGNAHAIQSLMNSTCPARHKLPDLSALEEVINFELTNQQGVLWQHYGEEFEKYSHQLNDGLVTRRVMLWVTKYPDKRIDAEQVAQEIGVEVKEVRASLEKLRWVDVVEKIGLISYKGLNDPIMRRYIEYQHYTEIEKLAPAEVLKNWQKEYLILRGHANNERGKFAEVHVGAVMRGFDGREVDGTVYFNQAGAVMLPRFGKLEKRSGIVVDGIAIEIDLIGEYEYLLPVEQEAKAEDDEDEDDIEELDEDDEDEDEEEEVQAEKGKGAWLVQVKYSKKRIRVKTVRDFLAQIEAMKSQGYTTTTSWFFAKGGFVKNAAKLLDEAGVLYSNRVQFNKLANLFDYFGLPE